MHEIPNIITERVDDMPLLLHQMQQMALPTLIDTPFPAHGNWYGLSLGGVSTIWLSAMLSRGDHRLVHVEPWVANRLFTLQTVTGQDVERLDCTDDRRAMVLRRLRDEARWAQCESRLHQHTGRGEDLRTERLHVDRTTASASARGSEGGLLPCGHRKDDRPDVPHVKVMQAVLDPLGMPLAPDGVSGERADEPLSVPWSARVQQSVGRGGLVCVGDCTRAAHATRAFIALAGASSWCPLPQGHLGEGELDEALERVGSGAPPRTAILREQARGEPTLIAQGYEPEVPRSVEVEGKRQGWTERRLVVRSVRPAEAAEAALRARVAKAKAHVEALHLRGRGRTRLAESKT